MMSETANLITNGTTALTKTAQKEYAEKIVNEVLEGDVNPIEAYVKVKAATECLNMVLKDSRMVDLTVRECEKYGKDTPRYMDATLCVTEAGVRYDFTNCNDNVWKRLSAQKAKIEEEMKAREKFLRSLSGGLSVIDEETGEVGKVLPPTKTSSTTVKVTFKK